MAHLTERADRFVQKMFGRPRPPTQGEMPAEPDSFAQDALRRLQRKRNKLMNNRRKI